MADSFGHGVWSLVYRDPVSGSLCIWHIVKYFTGLIQVKLLGTSYSSRWYVDIFFPQLTPDSAYPIDLLDMVTWQVTQTFTFIFMFWFIMLKTFLSSSHAGGLSIKEFFSAFFSSTWSCSNDKILMKLNHQIKVKVRQGFTTHFTTFDKGNTTRYFSVQHTLIKVNERNV